MIVRMRESHVSNNGYVFELRENIEICPRSTGDKIFQDEASVNKFHRLVQLAEPTVVSGLSKGMFYNVQTRISDGGLSIYTNNPDLI